MKFQHHLASHRNALACAHAAPSERQIRQRPFDDDALAGIMGGANLCRVLNRDSVIVAARIGLNAAKERGEPVRTELAPYRINGQSAEQAIGHASSRCQPRFGCPASRAIPRAHCESHGPHEVALEVEAGTLHLPNSSGANGETTSPSCRGARRRIQVAVASCPRCAVGEDGSASWQQNRLHFCVA